MATILFNRGNYVFPPVALDGEPLYTHDQVRLFMGHPSGVNQLVGVLMNVEATAAPTAGDDLADGYSPGSVWIYGGTAYTCVSNAAGAAVWTSGSGGMNQLTGDVTAGPGSGSQAAAIANNAVTYAKMQDVSAASKLLGRGASGAGDPQEITLGSGLSMTGTTLAATGSGGITQLTGDVTAGPGSGSVAATIANDAVTYAKLQNVSAASVLLGRGAGAGAGDAQEITVGSGLTMTGTTLSSAAATAPLTLALNDGGTNNMADVLILEHDSTGTPAAGLGTAALFAAETSTTTGRPLGRLRYNWNDVTDATRKAAGGITAIDSAGERDVILWKASGSAPQVGFLGAAPSSQLASPDVGTALTTFGLASGTPTFGAANLTGTALPTGLVADKTAMMAATSNVLAVTPGRTQYHPGVAKGYVNFNGTGTPAIQQSYNVSSITDNGVGDWTVNWTNAFLAGNYVASLLVGHTGAGPVGGVIKGGVAPTTSAIRVIAFDATFSLIDCSIVMVTAFGAQ